MEGIELEHIDGAATMAMLEEIEVVYAAAFPGYDLDDHQWRTERQARSPGFEAVLARLDRELIGFAYGLPLSPESKWWEGLRPPPAEEGFAKETGERTFAFIDLAVLPAQRGKSLGRRLADELLGARQEERATLATNPKNVRSSRCTSGGVGARSVGYLAVKERRNPSLIFTGSPCGLSRMTVVPGSQ